MANRRDLHVSVDADDRGFGPAFEDAQAKARGLDRELAKLERQQAAQEKVTARTAAAVDRFAKAEDKAGLAARKMGLEVKRSAEQAERAEVRAAAAAEAAAKGLLDKEKAAKLAARADDAVERAALKAAEAQLAEAAAAEKAAAAERKAAEAAEKHKASSVGMTTWLVSAGAAATALSVPVAAAGLAFVGMAAVAAPSIKKVIAAQADLGANWDTLDKGQKVAASNVASLVTEYKALAKSYEPDALAEFNGLVSTARGLLPELGKTVDSTKVGFMDFSTTVESSLNRQVPRLAGILQGQATPALHELGTTASQTAGLAVNLVQGLAPMGMTLLHDANGVLTLANALTSIDPRLTEFAVTAIALRAPTTALAGLWERNSSKLGLFGKGAEEAEGKIGGLAKGAAKTEGVMARLGKTVGSSPNLYIGAALAAVYLASRLSAAGDSTDHLIASLRTENNAFGNNIAGHRAVAQSLSGYIAQERAARDASLQGAGDLRDRQHITTVYNGQIRKLTDARKDELQAAANITAGEQILSSQYQVSTDQAGQLATAAGVDLSKSMTKSGQLTKEAAAKVRQYEAAVQAAQDPTTVIGLSLTAAGNSALGLEARMTALTNAWNALAGPAIGAFDATTKTAQAFGQLDEALKKSHGSLSQYTSAGQDARSAFYGLYTTLEQGIQAQYQYTSVTQGAKAAEAERAASTRRLVPLLLAEAGGNQQAQQAVLAFAKSGGLAAGSVEDLIGQLNLSKGAFLAAAHQAGIGRKAAEDLWGSFKKLSDRPAILRLDDREFLSKLHDAQGLTVDTKTGYLLGNNSGYFNSWLRANGLRIDTKTGLFKGNNADYYNKWLKANGLHIDTKTGQIRGNTAPFWASVHAIPSVVGHSTVVVTYSYQGNKALTPAQNHADGGIDRYAAGGMRRDLPPHVVDRPTVLYGETQTGGEAYIPLGPQKRTRSVMLLSDVARMFGMAVVKPATAMADGGIMAFASGGTTGVSLSDVLSQWSTAVSPASKSDVDAAIKARRTQLDQLANARAALRRAEAEPRKTHAERIRRAEAIAAAERRIRKERSDLADATKKLSDVERRYQAGRQSPATQLGTALGFNITNTGAFIRNLETLTDRGFGVLAQHLLAQGDASAEKIAADAVKVSSSKLSGLQKQVQQADQQQATLANLGSILTIKTAMKGGASTWDQLIAATGLSPNDLAATLKLMSADLAKTAAGQALLAMMKAHGFSRGGEIGGGPPGVDTVPLWATNGETIMTREATARNRQILAAMNAGVTVRIPTTAIRGGDGSAAGRPVEIHVHARDNQSALATAKATSHELGWELKKGG